jgi:WD40 repeat protein
MKGTLTMKTNLNLMNNLKNFVTFVLLTLFVGGFVLMISCLNSVAADEPQNSGEFIKIRGEARFADFSPDDKQIVISGLRYAQIYDVSTGEELQKLEVPNSDYIESAKYSPNGKSIVTACGDGIVRICHTASGKVLYQFKDPDGRSVKYAEFSPDGKSIVTTNTNCTIRIWDISTEKELSKFKVNKDADYVHFSPDGKLLIIPSDENVIIWDIATEKILYQYTKHTRGVHHANFSSNGKLAVTASYDGIARIFDVLTGKTLHKIQGHREHIGVSIGGVEFAEFSSDGKFVVTTGRDKGGNHSVRIWDAISGKELYKVLDEQEYGECLAGFSHDDKKLITIGKYATRIWDLSTIEQKLKKRVVNEEQEMSEREKLRRDAGLDNTNITADKSNKDKRNYTDLDRISFSIHDISSMQISPDGKWIAASVGGYSSNTVRIWDISTGKEVHILEGCRGRITTINFSPDGKKIMTNGGGTAIVWDVTTENEIHEFNGIDTAHFSPDGKLIVTVATVNYEIVRLGIGGDTTINISVWDAITGKKIVAGQAIKLPKHEHRWIYKYYTSFVNWTTDGKIIFASFFPDAHDHGYTLLWDSATGNLLKVIPIGISADQGNAIATKGILYEWPVKWLSFYDLKNEKGIDVDISEKYNAREMIDLDHNFGTFVFSDGERNKFIAKVSGAIICQLEEAKGFSRETIQFSNDGRMLVGHNYDDGKIHVWNTKTGEILFTLEIPKHKQVYFVKFSPASDKIIAAYADNPIRVWNLKDLQVSDQSPQKTDSSATDNVQNIADSSSPNKTLGSSKAIEPEIQSEKNNKKTTRTWTATNGHKIDGNFVKLEGGFVHLALVNGKTAKIKLDQLIDEDQTFIKQQTEKSKLSP